MAIFHGRRVLLFLVVIACHEVRWSSARMVPEPNCHRLAIRPQMVLSCICRLKRERQDVYGMARQCSIASWRAAALWMGV